MNILPFYERRNEMSGKQKRLMAASVVLILTLGIGQTAGAMHIMEGYLSGSFCIAWGVICLPFLYAGVRSIQKSLNQNRKVLPLLAMAGAFVFVISSLKLPSITGSCSHMTGTGLGALLFGPSAVSILGLIVLLFSGASVGTWRDDDSGSQYVFHGDCRTLRLLWHLQAL